MPVTDFEEAQQSTRELAFTPLQEISFSCFQCFFATAEGLLYAFT